MPARILLLVTAIALVIAPATAAAGDDTPTVSASVAAAAGVGDDGFRLDFVELGLTALFEEHYRASAHFGADEHGVHLVTGYAAVEALPADMTIRVGLVKSYLGNENERYEAETTFIDGPLALGKFFGPQGHIALGTDLRLTIPAPWTLRAFGGVTAGGGEGPRSGYGDTEIEIDGLRDFAYQIGVENRFEAGDDINVGLDIHGVFAPNDSGRTNGTDIFGLALSIGWRPDVDELGFALETEWLMRRRQQPGDVLSDMAGWAQLHLLFNTHWSLAGRYELTTAVDGKADTVVDPLDPLDDETRHRAQVVIGWSPVAYARLRLAGSLDMGGPLEDKVFAGYLQLQIGASTHGEEDE